MNRIERLEAILSQALALRDASLVIFRKGVLVEFKTGDLGPGLVAAVEGNHRSWQVGPFEGHHCHLDLASVVGVLFDAEPVSCQAGRINCTAWFLCEGDCGNPYRRDGLFSVTLNSPYATSGLPREDIFGPMFALHARHRDVGFVTASDTFLAAPAALGLTTPAAH